MIKAIIRFLSWKVFLRVSDLTENEYIEAIKDQLSIYWYGSPGEQPRESGQYLVYIFNIGVRIAEFDVKQGWFLENTDKIQYCDYKDDIGGWASIPYVPSNIKSPEERIAEFCEE